MANKNIKELVVVSGKGGTGKTSVVASFSALAEQNKVLADCDVDAADLHLVLTPEVEHREEFSGGKSATVIAEKCAGCGKCADVCRFNAVSFDGPANDVVGRTYRIDRIACEGCGVCAHFCPTEAIDFSPEINGEWFVSRTRHGPMVHAKLGIAAENSGKLVTLVRQEAKRVAEENNARLILVDASPGIGCPVIASLAGTDMALIVTEPTLSGLHDFERIAALSKHFGISTYMCVNKWDINPQSAEELKAKAVSLDVKPLGMIAYDPEVTKAQIAGLSVVKYGNSPAACDLRLVWDRISTML